MSLNSKIEWTETTWNPVTGCTKISTGCQNCYAYTLAKRLKAMSNPRYINGFDITLHDDLIDKPLFWKSPRKIFVNSMSDLFHENIPIEFIEKIFTTMNKAHWHTFQVLTKRSDNLKKLSPLLKWTKNIWMGVTVESYSEKYRIDDLKETDAAIKFLSLEPLLSSLGEIDLSKIDWVIVGGESGPKARPMNIEWVREIRDQCIEQNTPFFFKQWGGVNKKKNGRLLDGKLWDEYPHYEAKMDLKE